MTGDVFQSGDERFMLNRQMGVSPSAEAMVYELAQDISGDKLFGVIPNRSI